MTSPVVKAETLYNLFVYGSLRDKALFQSVCGFCFEFSPRPRAGNNILRAESGLILGYTIISPDRRYPYAMTASGDSIEGLMIHAVPVTAFSLIDRYEGCYYQRENVIVHTAGRKKRQAQAYLANKDLLQKDFGDRFDMP